jgi:hypothetical protein
MSYIKNRSNPLDTKDIPEGHLSLPSKIHYSPLTMAVLKYIWSPVGHVLYDVELLKELKKYKP